MAITTKPTGVSVNTGATWCPDLLWLIDATDQTAGNLRNQGKGSANTGTLANIGTGSVAFSTLSGQIILDFIGDGTTNCGIVRSANLQGVTTSFTMVLIVACSGTAVNNSVASVADISRTDTYGELRVDSSENIRVRTNVNNTVDVDTGLNVTPDTIHMIAWRFKQGDMGASLDGSNWGDAADGSAAFIGATNVYDGFSLGASGDSSPNQGATCKILACAIYADTYIDDGGTTAVDIATIYNGGDVWPSFGVTAGAAFVPRSMLLGVG